jgi:hypothetical protein
VRRLNVIVHRKLNAVLQWGISKFRGVYCPEDEALDGSVRSEDLRIMWNLSMQNVLAL